MAQPRDLELGATDGFRLAATVFEPEDAARATVVVAGATGVKRRYYRPFAADLAGRGLRVVTFDYRGIGGSAPASLRGFGADMRDWAEGDVDGVLAAVAARWPEAPALLVGHSFGGQALGLLRNAETLRGAFLVASQSGWWRLWPMPARLGMVFLWYAAIPLLTAVFGYMPARVLGLGEDLPYGVARQWARWGRHRDYVLSAGPDVPARFAAVSLPIRFVSLADDVYAPRRAVETLIRAYRNAERSHRHIAARDIGARKIGHFGFFRQRFREPLWREAGDWLLATAGAAPDPPPRDPTDR